VKKHHHSSKKKIYMIESCNSSTFNISQDIFNHLDSSDDHFFNSDYFSECDLNNSQDIDYEEINEFDSQWCSSSKSIAVVTLFVLLYGVLLVYLSVAYPELFSVSEVDAPNQAEIKVHNREAYRNRL